ncbi:hypothetical protein [Georhizobium profundi]|uniref:hypothetical protein n=1 Tax=Georhizobium profundi TaxID=2341112 RepID=UPI000F7E6B1B|nr:hypothetical protein [Georhizobium profundi]
MTDEPTGKVLPFPESQDPFLRCLGAGRLEDNERALFFIFDRAPTDDDLRFLHDVMRRAALIRKPGEPHG